MICWLEDYLWFVLNHVFMYAYVLYIFNLHFSLFSHWLYGMFSSFLFPRTPYDQVFLGLCLVFQPRGLHLNALFHDPFLEYYNCSTYNKHKHKQTNRTQARTRTLTLWIILNMKLEKKRGMYFYGNRYVLQIYWSHKRYDFVLLNWFLDYSYFFVPSGIGVVSFRAFQRLLHYQISLYSVLPVQFFSHLFLGHVFLWILIIFLFPLSYWMHERNI